MEASIHGTEIGEVEVSPDYENICIGCGSTEDQLYPNGYCHACQWKAQQLPPRDDRVECPLCGGTDLYVLYDCRGDDTDVFSKYQCTDCNHKGTLKFPRFIRNEFDAEVVD